MLGLLCGLALSLGPTIARAAPSAPEEDAGEAPLDPAIVRARDLHDAGTAAYDLADYETALEKFSAAYAALPIGPETTLIRSAIVYNVGITQKRMYELDGDLVHLKKAKVLLTKYFEEFGADGGDEDAKGRALLAEINATLEAARDAEPEPAVQSLPPAGQEDAPPPDDRTARVFIGVGAGLLGLGLAGAGLGVGGALWGQGLEADIEDGTVDPNQRIQSLQDGKTANSMALGGAIAGGVLLTAGAVVLTLGIARKRGRGRTVAVAPGPGSLFVGGRF